MIGALFFQIICIGISDSLSSQSSRTCLGAGGLQFKGLIEKNANLDEITENGTYIVQADHSIFKSGCILYVIKIERYIHHIAFDISGLFIQTRFKGYSGDWYTWMKINLSSLA